MTPARAHCVCWLLAVLSVLLVLVRAEPPTSRIQDALTSRIHDESVRESQQGPSDAPRDPDIVIPAASDDDNLPKNQEEDDLDDFMLANVLARSQRFQEWLASFLESLEDPELMISDGGDDPKVDPDAALNRSNKRSWNSPPILKFLYTRKSSQNHNKKRLILSPGEELQQLLGTDSENKGATDQTIKTSSSPSSFDSEDDNLSGQFSAGNVASFPATPQKEALASALRMRMRRPTYQTWLKLEETRGDSQENPDDDSSNSENLDRVDAAQGKRSWGGVPISWKRLKQKSVGFNQFTRGTKNISW